MMQQMEKKKTKKQKRIVWVSEGWKMLVGGFDIKNINSGDGLGNE